jgi:hypothetical protein
MLPVNNITKSDLLLAKLTKLIAAQTAGEVSGFSTDNLNHAYMSLAKGEVCEDTAILLAKMLGDDWAEGWEPAVTDEEMASQAMNLAVTETVEQIDITDPHDAVSTLASALMIACRELGWLEASRAAHDQWFYAVSVTHLEDTAP